MRIHFWPALVCGWIMAAMIGQTGLAADPADKLSEAASLSDDFDDSDQDEGLMDPEDASGIPSAFQPMQYADGGAYGGYPGGPPPDFSGGYAPEMPTNAWPDTSPFAQPRMSQVSNQTGLWQYDSDNHVNKKFIFSAEYLYAHGLRPGDRIIGDPNFNGTPVFPLLGPTTTGPPVFPVQSLGGLATNQNVFHDGFRLRYGYENPDESGLVLSGFILFENDVNNGGRIQNEVAGNLQPLASIIVNNNGTGAALPIDTRFYNQFTQQILGVDADYYSMPIFTRPGLKLKMLYGAKYLQVSEQFLVQGTDSGLGYDASTTPIAPPFTIISPNPYDVVIAASTTSNLVGPVLGLRYDVGGDKFKIWGQSKFGLMANIERLNVSSANVSQIKIEDPANPGVLIPGPAAGAGLTHTRVINTDTHISPLFETAINVEFPFFAMVPYVNRMNMFKNANVRIGWDFVVVDSVSRAAQIIKYNIGEPGIQSGRTWFEYNAFNFGVDWKW